METVGLLNIVATIKPVLVKSITNCEFFTNSTSLSRIICLLL